MPLLFMTFHSFFVISLGVIAPVPKTSPSVMSLILAKQTVYPPNGFFPIYFTNSISDLQPKP